MKRYPICLSLYGTTEELIRNIQDAQDADLFEIRLDLSSELQLDKIRSASAKPLLFTAHGRPDLLRRALPYADYLDVEREEPSDPRCIVSIHEKEEDPKKLWMNLHKTHLAKLVLETTDYRKITELLELDHAHHPRALCFAMGEVGGFSRILSVFYGSPWVYASLEGRSTGPGQFTLSELIEIYRLPRFSDAPRVFGIVGNPVSHSRSPHFHNQRFAEKSLPWIYLPFPCVDLPSLFRHAADFNVAGFSITHPYKEEALNLLQHCSHEAKELRSCNTVCFKNGEWHGMNSDVIGISEMLKKFEIPLRGARVSILGAGGAARAIASVVRPHVKELVILNRTLKNADELASVYQAKAGTLEDFGKFPYDVLFQATPVGLKETECPVNPSQLLKGSTVIEANYHPAETLLLKNARAIGCKVINGEAWFEAQAEAQFQWWNQLLNS